MRVDWSPSTNDKVFGRFSYANYESTERQARDSSAAWATSLTRRSATWRSTGTASINPTLVNELLFGYNQITIVSDTLDWAGIGNANATFGIAGGQPIAGLSAIGWGNGLTTVGAGASDTDTLDKTYQINEKLTWLTGRQQ